LTASIGNQLFFTFTVSHAPASDGSPLSNLSVVDDRAGAATRIDGDEDNDNLLDMGESWRYTATYLIQSSDLNPLVNTGLVQARDRENQLITATASHSTALIGFNPELFVDKDGPPTGLIGETVGYTFTVINLTPLTLQRFELDFLSIQTVGDGSPISMVAVTDNVAGPATYVRGDDNENNRLDGSEGWTYRANYTIQESDPPQLINQVLAQGVDQDGDTITATDTHRTVVPTPNTGNLYRFPLILKNK
jgi:hypothetical protein